MKRLEVSGAVRPIYVSLGVKRLSSIYRSTYRLNRMISRVRLYRVHNECFVVLLSWSESSAHFRVERLGHVQSK